MAYCSSTFGSLQSREQCLIHLCKCPPVSAPFNPQISPCKFSASSPINSHLSSTFIVAQPHVSLRNFASLCSYSSNEPINFRIGCEIRSALFSARPSYIRSERKIVKNNGRTSVVEEEGIELVNKDRINQSRRFNNSEKRSQKDSGFRSKENVSTRNFSNIKRGAVNGKVVQKSSKRDVHSGEVKGQKVESGSKKSKADPTEVKFRTKLDMCSKNGDVMGAIALYDSAVAEGLKLGQYHYTVLLYLCSSAAVGVMRPGKSGSSSRSLDMSGKIDSGKQNLGSHPDKIKSLNKSVAGVRRASNAVAVADYDDDDDDSYEEEEDNKDQSIKQEMVEIWVSEDVKQYALQRGFELYEKMRLEDIPMNEATLTSIARMAMAMGNGDMAFDMVKQMKALGINPKLRSYGPALSTFCSSRQLEKAFEVEKHMLENGVQPEEPELEALLRVSVEVGKADMVYYLLHQFRVAVRFVSSCTADLIERWFTSTEASRVGKRKWSPNTMKRTMETVGGGWHGQGWLGRGKWTVTRTSITNDGLCKCCGAKLALIDLDPEETEKFAESVAAIAAKREKNASFQSFQKWLNYYGPYEAVVDAANVGLYSQRKFQPAKVNAIVNGIRQMLPSKRWPLIVLHNRRVTGSSTDKPVNKALIEKWRDADALFATPTGSNDDWYWLYAAIRFKCLLVTNDEMRDHTFQLLGNDFFTKWKERHQVRFSFSEVGPVFHMPPPFSVVIQESEIGHWHVPIVSEHQSEGARTWLCISRGTELSKQDSMSSSEDDEPVEDNKVNVNSQTQIPVHEAKSQRPVNSNIYSERQLQSSYRNLKSIVLGSEFTKNQTILTDIEAAEKLGNCVIDFQI